MAIGKGNVGPVRAVVVAGIGIIVILAGGVGGGGVILISENPDVRRTAALPVEIQICKLRISQLVRVASDDVLGLANRAACRGYAARGERIEKAVDFVTVADCVLFASAMFDQVLQIGRVAVQPSKVIRHVGEIGTDTGRVGGSGGGRGGFAHGILRGGTNERAHVGEVLRHEPVHIVIGVIGCAGQRVLLVVISIHLAADTHLFLVVQATDPLGAGLGLGQRRQ